MRYIAERRRVLRAQHGNPRTPVRGRIDLSSTDRDPAYTDERVTGARDGRGNMPQSSVHRNHEVEAPARECGLDRFLEVRVPVNVFQVVELGQLVHAPMKDRHVVSALAQARDDMRSRRSGAADDERLHRRRGSHGLFDPRRSDRRDLAVEQQRSVPDLGQPRRLGAQILERPHGRAVYSDAASSRSEVDVWMQ